MKFFSFSLCLFILTFALSNQFLKNNKLRNLDDEKNIIEIEILSDSTGEVSFIESDYLEKIEKIIVNGTEMTENKSSTTVNANEKYTITIQFKNDFKGSCGGMFGNLKKIKKIKFQNFNGCTSADSMFAGCSSLESLDLSSFDSSKVYSMVSTFDGCSSLEFLDLSSFNTSSLTSMEAMFYGCSKLESLDLSSFDTSKVTEFDGMFFDCISLESLNFSSFNTSSVKKMENMFYNCYSLSELILSSSFTMVNVENYDDMFPNYYISVTQNEANLKADIKNLIDATNSIRDLKKT